MNTLTQDHLLNLLKEISELKSLEQKSKQCKKELQHSIVHKQRIQKEKELRSTYADWFFSTVESLKGEQKTHFEQTRNHLDIALRIEQGIKILSKIRPNEAKKQVEPTPQQWKKLISQGESDRVEFKSSLRWDYNQQALNKQLEIGILKTIIALLNSKGGFLFIGVQDSGQIVGIEKDLPTLKRQDGDGFIQYLLQIINFHIGKEFNNYISIIITVLDDKQIVVVKILPSDLPSFLKVNNNEFFYIRASLSSQPLNVRETSEYIKMHWKD